MSRSAILELGAHLLSKCHPKMAKELGITIQNYGPWNAMQSHHFFEVQLGNMGSIICLGTRDEMGHLSKAVHNHKDGVFAPLCPW